MSQRSPVLEDGKLILRKLWYPNTGAVIKAVNDEARTVSHVITARVVDRDGDVVVPRGGKFNDYLKNPVVFFNHRSFADPPIGKCLALDVTDDEVIATTKFAGMEQAHPMAETVFRLMRDGFMRGWSMGFMVDTIGTQRLYENQVGKSILEWTLLEYSAVGIPANPDALTRMVKRLGLPEGATEKDLYDAVAGPQSKLWSLALPIDGDLAMDTKKDEKGGKDDKVAETPAETKQPAAEVASVVVDLDKLVEKLLPVIKAQATQTIVVKSEEAAQKMAKAHEALSAAAGALTSAVAAVAEAAEAFKCNMPRKDGEGDATDKGTTAPGSKDAGKTDTANKLDVDQLLKDLTASLSAAKA